MTLQFDGCAFFRQRLALSTLSCQPIKIKNIRSQENEPGLRGIPFLTLKSSSILILNRFRNQSPTSVRKTD